MRKNTFSGFTFPVYFKLVFAAILCLATLCGCGGNAQDVKEVEIMPEPADPPLLGPIVPIDFNDTELGRQIRQDYLDELHSSGVWYLLDQTIDDVWITSYYGIYNGSVPLMITNRGAGYSGEVKTIVVADIKFTFGGNIMSVWKEGEFYSLEEAYNLGFLTQEDLRGIADLCPPIIN